MQTLFGKVLTIRYYVTIENKFAESIRKMLLKHI